MQVHLIALRIVQIQVGFPTNQELDELSTHTTVDEHYIDKVSVTKLSSNEISYLAEGNFEVDLQYLFNHDTKNDIVFRQDTSYSYVLTTTCSAIYPVKLHEKDLQFTADNVIFYEQLTPND